MRRSILTDKGDCDEPAIRRPPGARLSTAVATPPTAASPGKKPTTAWQRFSSLPAPVLGLIGTLIFLLVWEIVPRIGLVSPRYVPPASEVLALFARNLTYRSFWAAT